MLRHAEADRLLETFAQTSNKDMLDPQDWCRFYAFIIAAHRMALTGHIADVDVLNRLEELGFSHLRATLLAVFYTRAMDLLTLFEQSL